ncbi:hypothetical protein [Erythrobacter sp.]|jgi:hypothetical protein|uniref:hypothetical protein n=1 Tax=Erythrobacter sp. TaxID=1042 RepID=UPI002EC71E47|nr:hypothetical protein [Erythrobacter sp.]
MSAYSFRSSGSDKWVSPRQSCDPWARRYHYGKIQPMEEARPGLLSRLLRSN